jgi:hypothetical protein
MADLFPSRGNSTISLTSEFNQLHDPEFHFTGHHSHLIERGIWRITLLAVPSPISSKYGDPRPQISLVCKA